MRRPQVHSLLRTLAESHDSITDLNFTPGKPPQVERNGELSFPFVDPPLPVLTPYMTEHLAMMLIENRQALMAQLIDSGAWPSGGSGSGRPSSRALRRALRQST